jgi:tetratricopeptide (TPR) repeat protein
MRRQAYESAPLPYTLRPDQYRTGTRDAVYVIDNPRIKRNSVGLKEAVDFIANDNPATKLQQADNAAYLPKKVIRFKVDKEAVIRNKVVEPQDYDKIVDEIVIDLSNKNMLSKDEMMILDLLATNNWERPIYWSITVGRSKYLNLQDYFQLEGFAYRLVPIKTKSSPQSLSYGRVASDIMYKNLMEKFDWGNMNGEGVYLDETNRRMMTNVRNNFHRLASALVEEGKNDSAIAVIDRCNELLPNEIIPFEYFALSLAEDYIKAGAREKGVAMMEEAFTRFNNELAYYLNLGGQLTLTAGIGEEIQRNMFYLQSMERMARSSGETELATKIGEALQAHFQAYSGANA